MKQILLFALLAAMVIILLVFPDEVGGMLWAAATAFGAWFTDLVLTPLTD
jgi:hypothetical protein